MFRCLAGVRIKRGYGRTDEWRTDGDGLEWLEKRFLYHIRVLSFRIKRGYGLEWLEKRFIYPIRVLSFWIKRGYGLEWLEKRLIYPIRVLSFWIWLEKYVSQEFMISVRPSVRPPLIRPSVRHSSVRPYPRFILTLSGCAILLHTCAK